MMAKVSGCATNVSLQVAFGGGQRRQDHRLIKQPKLSPRIN
jgi:hypothetical protein